MKTSYRKPGKITTLDQQSIPINCLYFDVETYVKNTRDKRMIFPPRLGIAIFNRMNEDGTVKYRFVTRFTTPQQFVDILNQYTHKTIPLYIFGHNIGFDIRALGLPRLFKKLGYRSEPPIINHRMFIWSVKTLTGELKFVDTANFAVISVEQLGADLGFPKMHVDFRTKDTEALYVYCQRDVEILEQFMQSYIYFIRSNNLGKFCVTLASQAMTAWRTRFMDTDVYLHCDDKLSRFERSAYHGGRTECFRIGLMPKDTYYYLDINSMYPYVMKNYDMPVKFVGISAQLDMERINSILTKYYIIADCIIDTDEPAYALVHENKLIFPVGKFRVVLHHSEFAYAVEHGHIIQVINAALYKKAKIFTSYVDFFYQVKVSATLEHNASWRFIAKIFLNSLYGKMGQLNPVRMKLNGEFPDDIIRSIGYNDNLDCEIVQLVWFKEAYYEFKSGDAYLANCAIAGAVTAYSRMLLYSYIRSAGLSHVFYCDTDSLITDYTGYKHLYKHIDKAALGKLKIENKSTVLHIYTNKDYQFGRHRKTKGISHKAKRLATDTWEQLQFQSFNAWMNEHGVDWPSAKKVVKRRRMAYNKGIVDKETGIVSPISLSLD